MNDLTPEAWRRLSRLLDEAAALPPGERAAHLERACAADPELRPHVVRLLEAGDRLESILDSTRGGPAASLLRERVEQGQRPGEIPEGLPVARRGTDNPSSSAPTEPVPPSGQPHDTIGPYDLLQKVGEGGMGEVWLAEQHEPVRRKVALKLIKAGMDTKEVIARFEAERQALALMDHPAIAKVLDAGATSRGLPYFAMEYVPGAPITTYCDRQRLRTRERLDLFIQACEGVQHAHQKGILHRDLKPSNVLVSLHGDRPVPRIIDFGVAKATGARLTDRTMFTALGVLIGTPEYMSPEQAELTSLGIDTRTDVYALGMILYELLAGVLPFQSKDLRSQSFDELRRKIREEEPPRPSTKVKMLGERSTEIARRRQTDPGRLISRLRGDLDWIVMKALEKDRTRRYGSPSDLAADLGRHLRYEPVLAGPPGAAYRAGKFIRRHRFGVAAAAVGVVGLLAFATTTAVQAARIAKERDRANREAEVSKRVSEFMTGLFQVSDPSEARGNTVTAREILDQGAEQIDKELANSPEIQAQLMHTMGEVYRRLGLAQRTEQLLERAVEVRRRVLGPEHPDTLLSTQSWGWAKYARGQLAEAEQILKAVLEAQRRVIGSEHADTARTASVLGSLYASAGRRQEAEALLTEALGIRRRVLGAEHGETLRSMTSLASLYISRRQFTEAEALVQEALATGRSVLGADHPVMLSLLIYLGETNLLTGRYKEAEPILREAVDRSRRVLGDKHEQTLGAMGELANTLQRQGRFAESEALNRELLELRRRSLGPDHPYALSSMNNLAAVLLSQARYDEAERLLKEVLERSRRVLPPGHTNTAQILYNLGCVAALRGRREEALDWLRQAVEGGHAKYDDMTEDPDLRSLRGDPEFERLVATARKNAGQ